MISLKSDGGGANGTIISAINHAVEIINSWHRWAVINKTGLDAAVKNAADQGIRFSNAGNSGDDADGYSPASAGDHENVSRFQQSTTNTKWPPGPIGMTLLVATTWI